ncbi:uncharacterized protein LOC117186486 [Drosophila miranda]|uniref:uncharacterized protein LOC117186213 n=1 Tax=Drosophila miranda TaxID=7229 RepID=UPI00143F55A7|nr:uncharacterized protein LOC117186213 [Drosophila miranda]XP_033243256.1 uncharacterized protein LOC117186486 [Drosophila miranda]
MIHVYSLDSKLNGLNVNVARTRPRFPTPEVAKDGSTNPGHPATAALAQAINMKDGFPAVSREYRAQILPQMQMQMQILQPQSLSPRFSIPKPSPLPRTSPRCRFPSRWPTAAAAGTPFPRGP